MIKARVEQEQCKQLLLREVEIQTRLKHPNIINLMEVIFDENYVMLIMELANGGELYRPYGEDVHNFWLHQTLVRSGAD